MPDAPETNYTQYLDTICPYYMLYGMSYDEFWNSDLNRLKDYWQMHQFSIEKRNQELWMQGLYIREAIVSAFDLKHQSKYPEKPHRITEMTDAEKEAESKMRVERLREQLMEIKRRSDARNKGVEPNGR